MRVRCQIKKILLKGAAGGEIASVRAMCSECSHRTESFGTTEASVKRCMALMREECPEHEKNYYTPVKGWQDEPDPKPTHAPAKRVYIKEEMEKLFESWEEQVAVGCGGSRRDQEVVDHEPR